MVGVSPFKKLTIGGFGKIDEYAMLWNMDRFLFSDQECSIEYKGMKIAVMNKPSIPCDMILSASMFMKMKYIIDCSSRKHLLTIEADRKVYGVGYYDKRETIIFFRRNRKPTWYKSV